MRMNISIPDALRERMKAFDESVNWSAIAADAFSVACERQEHLAGIDDPVKRRLEQTEQEDEDTFQQQGHAAGAHWAKTSARKAHLRRLAGFLGEDVFETAMMHSGALALARAALGEVDVGWDDLPGAPDLPDAIALEGGWLQGFIEGAVDVFEAL